MNLRTALLTSAAVLVLGAGPAAAESGTPIGAAAPASGGPSRPGQQDAVQTATPIKHLIVVYNENVSFDHYFGTYPSAANPPGEPPFRAARGTPSADTLSRAGLLKKNPNTGPANGDGASAPFRLDRTQANTADQNHLYTAEQQAYHNGKADLFPKYTGKGSQGGAGAFGTSGQVMGYFDGNTVAGLWRYAQGFAMSDNAFSNTYGPSTPGMLEVVSGQTNGMRIVTTSMKPSTLASPSYYIADGQGGWTMINDVDPAEDVCSSKTDQVMMQGRNIGDLLNDAGLTWGGFMGGFNLQAQNPNGSTGCTRSTQSEVVGKAVRDYVPHHAWFQYYASTTNATHARPASVDTIGYSLQADGKTAEPANHQYDLTDFYTALKAGNFPSVSYIKMQAYQDGHAGYSDPLDEQAGTIKLLNFLQQQPEWSNTAVVLAWDDSDGWYDHAYRKPSSTSFDAEADQLSGAGKCGAGPQRPGVEGKPVNGRCGPGTRVPFLVVSPWARANHVDHAQISQASVVRFIEDNWLQGKRLGGGSFDASAGSITGLFNFAARRPLPKLFLDPKTGEVLKMAPENSPD